MARYTGPKHKLARREGVNVIEKESPSLQRRLNIPPGQHGRKRKKRLSEYGAQLREKQKAKAIYGILEKQFKNLVKTVTKKKGETGEMLLALLETRADNIVYRLGFAKTRSHARQLVSHGHVLINEKKVSIPSYQVKVGDIISLSNNMQNNPGVLEAVGKKDAQILPFLKKEGMSGKVIRIPKREDLQVLFDLQPIIEYYSR
ncbi:MAG: 30S ribosomal protein S4 [Candidatus Levybacteria bacterium RIFCSPHIGHO2_02_FULL_37_13]|nr:MAG: 30S ribosomal protein S4 [Candidatus Levybacteria bacterium RIFCSPHIGHO2_02_FULL_37_13]OGH29811.1 MAG: 30S ribosomal protein S4 [Candidatus Levybacteria bacterium RIFCSPHIGHO2_12_FULL_37_9]OGH40000.1 MAG: 30S ribosomal protein S4 [Candidatus Levybacteria bacterium RIFCSPLOWO2_01_FULL_37_26]